MTRCMVSLFGFTTIFSGDEVWLLIAKKCGLPSHVRVRVRVRVRVKKGFGGGWGGTEGPDLPATATCTIDFLHRLVNGFTAYLAA